MARRLFKPGDMVHVPSDNPRRSYAKWMWSDVSRDEELPNLKSPALIVTLEKRGDEEFAYVLPSKGPMGWLKLGCCVRKLEERSTDFLHEVRHMKIIKQMREDWDGENWFGFSLITLVLMALIALFIVGISALRADNKIDGCYTSWHASSETMPGITTLNGAYVIKGHIPWRSDVMLGSAPTSMEANELMRQVCPVK